MTIQQVICNITDNRQRIFTGAERMGNTDRVLLTFDKEDADKAQELITNIVQVLESLTLSLDHSLIADESKMPSRETNVRQRAANHQYMETIMAEWFDFENDETSCVSTLSSSEAS